MLLEKTLHMSQPVAECKARLASIQSYRRQFLMVTRATVTSSKTVDFSFRGPFSFEAHTVLLSVDGDSPNQYAFESVGGNISLMGIVDFAEIRPHCTEVTLAVHYEIKNKLFAWLDRRLHFVDSFVNAELRSIRAHFEGIRSSYLERPRVMPVLSAGSRLRKRHSLLPEIVPDLEIWVTRARLFARHVYGRGEGSGPGEGRLLPWDREFRFHQFPRFPV